MSTKPSAAPERTGALKSLVLTALALLNLALVVSLAGQFAGSSTAQATSSQPAARVSEYMIIPSRPLGMTQDVLYVFDMDNAALAVAGYDAQGKRIGFVGPLRLREIR